MSNTSEKRKIWQFPWGYDESFIIAFTLLFIGFVLEFLSSGKITQLPPWPVNIIILTAFIIYLIISFFLVKGPIMQWLTSVPAAMSAMTTFTFLVLLMGFIPQGEPTGFAGKIGLHHVHTSKPYIIIAVYMLTILGFTIIKRLSHKLSLKNMAFLLNHVGLFVILTAASIGSSDMMRLKMHVSKGETTNIAFPDTRHKAEMPFSLQLNAFTIEEYPPELIIYNRKTGMPVSKKGKAFPFIEEGKTLNILDYNIDVISFLPYAVPVEDKYEPTEQFGSTHAALIQTTDGNKGWISCGNFMYPPKYVQLDNKYIAGMSEPRVKRKRNCKKH